MFGLICIFLPKTIVSGKSGWGGGANWWVGEVVVLILGTRPGEFGARLVVGLGLESRGGGEEGRDCEDDALGGVG